MNWQNIIKSSDSYWQTNRTTWSFCCLNYDYDDSKPATRKTIHTKDKKISHYWSKEDDKKLLKLVEKYKFDWDLIADKFSDKSSIQVSNRWKNKVNPELKHSEWTEEEDLVLKTLVLEFGYKWETLSNYIKGRSEQELKKRFNNAILPELTNKELFALQDTLEKVKSKESSVEIDINDGDENALMLTQRVTEWQKIMNETIQQIQVLENDLYEPREVLAYN